MWEGWRSRNENWEPDTRGGFCSVARCMEVRGGDGRVERMARCAERARMEEDGTEVVGWLGGSVARWWLMPGAEAVVSAC